MTDESGSSSGVRLSLLTKENCPLCDHAKAVLDRVEVHYVASTDVVWLETPEGEEFAERHHTPFPPVLLIDGELHGYGRLSERKLRRELDRMKAPRRPFLGRLMRNLRRSVRWRPQRDRHHLD